MTTTSPTPQAGADKAPQGDALRFLAGGGEMRKRIRDYDWTGTPLGPPHLWPQPLRFALDICLNSTFPTSVYWGPDLRLLYNDTWSAIPADKHPWALGRPAREVWSDIWNIIEPQFARVVATGQGFSTFDQMLPLERKGRIHETYWNYSFTPIHDERGVVVGVFNQGHETTSKVLAERERENEIERWRETFSQAPGAVALLRGPEHIFEIANAAYQQLVGRADIIGKRLIDVLPEGGGEGFLRLLDHVYHTGEPFIGSSVSVALNRKPDLASGNRILDFICQPITDPDGAISGVFVQATDVTDRESATAALRSSEEHLRRLNQDLERRVEERTAELSTALATLQETFGRMRTAFETSFVYQGYVNTEGVVLDANPASLAAIQAPASAVLGKFFWDTPWFSNTPGMSEAVRTAVLAAANGETLRRTLRVNLPIGERTFNFTMRPVRNDAGDVIGVIPEAVDVTRLMETQEHLRQSQKMEAVGQLTGGIAHDFNNLLTGIVGSLELMERRIAQQRYEDVARYASAAMTSANRAAALTHRLLAFSRRQPLDPKPVDVNVLVADMEDMLRRALGEHVHLDINTGSGLWLTRCDPNQLENAILNLVINARDAMSDGGTITITTSNTSRLEHGDRRGIDPGEYVCIATADTGTGMSPEVMEKAFDPFFTTKPPGHGTGLGLSMIYGFIKQSHGHIVLESRVGAGTTIKLYLPRLRGESLPTEPSSRAADEYRASAGDTVLVVEDDAIVRQLTCDSLRDLGYRVLDAADGKAGLKVLSSAERIDLLITDVGLPELSGREMVEQARAHRPDLKVLFITGYAENATFDSSARSGVQMLTKPFHIEALAQRVQQMIAR